MWMSAGRGWPALAALALGTAEAAVRVSFTTGFEGSFGNVSRAILDYGAVLGGRPFVWTSTGVTVDRVTLYMYDVDAQKDVPKRSWKAVAPKDTPDTTRTVVNPGFTPLPESSSALDDGPRREEDSPNGQTAELLGWCRPVP